MEEYHSVPSSPSDVFEHYSQEYCVTVPKSIPSNQGGAMVWASHLGITACQSSHDLRVERLHAYDREKNVEVGYRAKQEIKTKVRISMTYRCIVDQTNTFNRQTQPLHFSFDRHIKSDIFGTYYALSKASWLR
jgi:hypothetical protein